MRQVKSKSASWSFTPANVERRLHHDVVAVAHHPPVIGAALQARAATSAAAAVPPGVRPRSNSDSRSNESTVRANTPTPAGPRGATPASPPRAAAARRNAAPASGRADPSERRQPVEAQLTGRDQQLGRVGRGARLVDPQAAALHVGTDHGRQEQLTVRVAHHRFSGTQQRQVLHRRSTRAQGDGGGTSIPRRLTRVLHSERA